MFVGQTHRRRERLKERIKWRRTRGDVPVQSNMPRHPQPEAEGVQRSGRRSGRGPSPRPGPGEAQQADVLGDGAATLRPSDVVDGKQTQQCGGAQTTGGVPQLPLAVAARHGQEPDRHGLQVTSLTVCVWMLWMTLLEAHIYRLICCHGNPDSITAKRDGCCSCWLEIHWAVGFLWFQTFYISRVTDLLLWLVGFGACSYLVTDSLYDVMFVYWLLYSQYSCFIGDSNWKKSLKSFVLKSRQENKHIHPLNPLNLCLQQH